MRSTKPDPERWNLISPEPNANSSFWRWNMAIISFLTFLVIGVFVAAIATGLELDMSAADKVQLKIDKDPAPVNLAEFKDGYAPVIDPALPAVVNISSTKLVKQQNNFPGLFSDPFFRQFFGDQFGRQLNRPETEREYSLGSGVVANPDGYILTNDHVVSGASDIQVFTQDKKKFKAKVIGTDTKTDIAVLKIDARGLPALTLGDSSKLKVGDVVFAIGDPFGVGETATMGIVSATGRGLGGALEHYENFIQTDAAINLGNSGDALIDLHGDLVGINTAIITGGGGGSQGVGFAIPIDMARNVMEQIVDHGKVVRGQLGVTIQSVGADMAKAFGLNQGGGALVSEVTAGSPAAKVGIERGDIILALNGKTVSGPDDLSVHISEMSPGSTVHLKIVRNGQTRDVTATLSELTEKPEESARETASTSGLRGLQVENLTPSIARQLGVPESTVGVVVTAVDSASAAAAADIERGDVIEEVNRKPIRNVADYDHTLAGTDNQAILLLVSRGGSTRFIVVSPE